MFFKTGTEGGPRRRMVALPVLAQRHREQDCLKEAAAPIKDLQDKMREEWQMSK